MKRYKSFAFILILQVFSLEVYSQIEQQNKKASSKIDITITPNQYKKGSDSDRIEAAINDALKTGINSIEIPRIDLVRGKTEWLVDRAIVLPSDFTLNLNNCLVRLAKGAKDNIITNSGARTSPLSENNNIRIIGKGNAVLSGGVESNFNPPGDRSGFKTIGILLFNTKHFTIEGFKMEETQTYAISIENGCAYGRIANIEFHNTNKYPNQDGVDVLKGCHDIIIENITGITGDDTVALTGLRRATTLKSYKMEIVGSRITEEDDIYNIIINNVQATTAGGDQIVRLLNHDGIKMYNIFISNIMDTSKDGEVRNKAAVLIGSVGYYSISKNQLGETSRIFINNVLSRSKSVINIQGTLKDAIISNVAGYGGILILLNLATLQLKM